jgi:hypothetical protein
MKQLKFTAIEINGEIKTDLDVQGFKYHELIGLLELAKQHLFIKKEESEQPSPEHSSLNDPDTDISPII